MAIKLTKHAGGGVLYTPAMTSNDGTGYQQHTTVTQTGNAITFIAKVRIEPQVTARHLLYVRELTGTATAPCNIRFFSSGDATYPNRMYIQCNDSDNVPILKAITSIPVSDGLDHAIKVEYDATAGTISMMVDGVEVEDATYVSRILSTGTLSNDVNTTITFQAEYVPANYLIGAVGHAGLAFASGFTFSDFFDSDNNPIEIDETTWAAWNDVQPAFWSPFGNWGDNRGAAGNAVMEGSMAIDGAHATGHPMLGLNTDGTAVAANIDHGRTTWINGEEVVGTAPGEGGGGTLYTPAMMEYDGTTSYYKLLHSKTGNKITVVCRFNIASFTGAGIQRIAQIRGSTSVARADFYVVASDHADPNAQSRLIFVVKNSAGTVICTLGSKVDADDGVSHTIFASFDGDLGVATYYMDSVDTDDLGYTSRVAPTTGTLDTGSGNSTIGASLTPSTFFDGAIGYFGYHDVYLTNWYDFMSGSYPNELDTTTWTEWGTQPLLWSTHGALENNKGTGGNMAVFGTIELSDTGSTGHPMIGIDTVGDATAADIAEGKIAWVNGVEIVGAIPPYDPGMMTFNGTSYYSVGNFNVTTNKHTVVGRFNVDIFSDVTQVVMRVAQDTIRCQVEVVSDNNATTEIRQKLIFSTYDSTGTIKCRLLSKITVTDSLDHTFFCSYDGDNGTAILYVDGIDADDLTYGGRLLLTGTLETGATLDLGVGADQVGSNLFTGQIGHFGYNDVYLTNPTDFADTSGPKEIDRITWGEWSEQPLFWNQFCTLTDNKGSGGNAVINGTITGPS